MVPFLGRTVSMASGMQLCGNPKDVQIQLFFESEFSWHKKFRNNNSKTTCTEFVHSSKDSLSTNGTLAETVISYK